MAVNVIFAAHQTRRIGQPQHGRTVNDDLSVTVSEREIETRSADQVENQPEPVTYPRVHYFIHSGSYNMKYYTDCAQNYSSDIILNVINNYNINTSRSCQGYSYFNYFLNLL